MKNIMVSTCGVPHLHGLPQMATCASLDMARMKAVTLRQTVCDKASMTVPVLHQTWRWTSGSDVAMQQTRVRYAYWDCCRRRRNLGGISINNNSVAPLRVH